MFYIAFTLGLLGSLHCLGMCGPLAIGLCSKPNPTKKQNFINALTYNLGRILTYTLLGLLFGLIGSFLFIVNLQKYLSVIIGIVLIISVVFSLSFQSRLLCNSIIGKLNFAIKIQISKLIQSTKTKSTFVLGMINGLLPCGLVYLAIAGSLSLTASIDSAIFMASFGIGTLPALFLLIIGSQNLNPGLRVYYRRILPFINLFFGVFLIYRGIVVDLPLELNFWEALKNPIMCH